MNYYQFHIGDYISHTSHLSDLEDLAYRRMLDLYYLTEAPFTDVALVARKIRSTPQIVQTLLDEFFVLVDGGWRNPRCDDEIEKVSRMSSGGKSGAEKRWARYREAKASPPETDAPANGEVIAPLSPPQCPPNSTHNPIPNTHISSLRSDSASEGKSEKGKRARQIPEDYQPTDDHRRLAAELGLSIDREFAKFADHHRARGTVFKDWDAALRTWLRKSLDFGAKPGPITRSVPMSPEAVAIAKDQHKVFVEEGSEDWFAWKAVRKSIPVADCKLQDGQIKRGWHFPSARP